LTRTPFAVKSGGHSLNPGFSSTSGVHISLRRMDDIIVYEDSKTVEIGAGLTWIDVYAYLVPKGINVVGARLGTVGVGGYTLGGGDSFLSTGKAHSMGELKNPQDIWVNLHTGSSVEGSLRLATEILFPRRDILGKPTSMGLLWTI
jgi:FAD binding domain